MAFAFLSALRTLAQRQRVLLAIDDVQWLDAPSLAMLRYALPRLEGEPVAALLAARDVVPPWLLRAIRRERLAPVELGPLSLGALHELLRSRTGTAFPRPLLLRICETSGGNPFFALELASAVERRGGVEPGEELPIPTALEELVLERLATLGAAGTHVTRVVAALVEPTTHLVELAAGEDANGVSRRLSTPASSRSRALASRSLILSCARPCRRARRRVSSAHCTRASRASFRAASSRRGTSRSPRLCRTARSRPSSKPRPRACGREERLPPRSSWPTWRFGSRRRRTSTTSVGGSSTAPTGCARPATAAVPSPSSRSAQGSACGPIAATVLLRLARVVEVVDGPREAVDSPRGARRGAGRRRR